MPVKSTYFFIVSHITPSLYFYNIDYKIVYVLFHFKILASSNIIISPLFFTVKVCENPVI